MRNYCSSCVNYCLKDSVGSFYEDNKDECNLHSIFNNKEPIKSIELLDATAQLQETSSLWPSIPLGQMIWAFVHDSSLASLARTWMTAQSAYALRRSQDIDSCPQHPSLLFKRPPPGHTYYCPCHLLHQRHPNQKDCTYYFCSQCSVWHRSQSECKGKLKLQPGFRICPNCHEMVEKSEVCNHLHCRCGADFCYYCGAGPFSTAEECYNHLNTQHGGYSKNPPDYRKFCQNDTTVTDAELEAFYNYFPHLRPED